MTTPIRKRKLGETRRREVCAILAVGGSREIAAQYVGCAETAIQAEAVADAQFREQLERAESQLELSYLRNIQSAAKKEQYWRAAAWALERKYPQRYGKRQQSVVSAEQMARVLTQLGEIIAQEVPDETQQGRVLARLKKLTIGIARPRRKRRL
ncbi:MAG TPA: hypothetical protein VG713_22170 [Pirellulales bacterium]|nr:hypothetical protein [Pirellulales bacterium]